MISLETKVESTTSLPISSDKSTNEEPELSFAQLLKGFNTKDDKKNLQTIKTSELPNKKETPNTKIGTKDLDIEKKDSPKDSLLSLLKGDKQLIEKDEIQLEINPKATENMTPKEVKLLIKDAKEYLKEQIVNSDGYKQAKIKELPQTLKGLTKLAKEFKIDVSKISVEVVQIKDSKDISNNKTNLKPTLLFKTEVSKEHSTEQLVQTKQPKIETKSEKVNILKEVLQLNKNSLESSDKGSKPTIESTQLKTLPKEESLIKNSPKSLAQLLHGDKDIPITDSKDIKKSKQLKNNSDSLKELLNNNKQKNIDTNHNLVDSTISHEVKKTTTKIKDTPKTLKELLQNGKNIDSTNTIVTTKISTNSTQVIDSKPIENITKNNPKSLEQLLHGDKQTDITNQTNFKVESITPPKADSLDVKLHEAKQMIKYISSDVKDAIEDYKSPFTRIKVQLNPQKLGEIDLTVIQRGKNLHVNLSSNNVAINTLAQNINELRVQLNNSGINNATLNFNNSSQNPDSNQHQGQREQQRDARREYNYFEDEEKNEEILNSLEIIVPRYI